MFWFWSWEIKATLCTFLPTALTAFSIIFLNTSQLHGTHQLKIALHRWLIDQKKIAYLHLKLCQVFGASACRLMPFDSTSQPSNVCEENHAVEIPLWRNNLWSFQLGWLVTWWPLLRNDEIYDQAFLWLAGFLHCNPHFSEQSRQLILCESLFKIFSAITVHLMSPAENEQNHVAFPSCFNIASKSVRAVSQQAEVPLVGFNKL